MRSAKDQVCFSDSSFLSFPDMDNITKLIHILPQGGKCGSTYIDREFRKLLARRFGRAFEMEPEVFKSPKSRLMQEFEKVKRNFGSTDDDCFEVSGINLRGEFSEEHYDSSEGAVLLSK